MRGIVPIFYLMVLVTIGVAAVLSAAQAGAQNPGHPADQIGEGTIAGVLSISASDGVGIGTDPPTGAVMLEVDGDVYVAGGMTSSGDIESTGGAVKVSQVCIGGDCRSSWPPSGVRDGDDVWFNSLRIGGGSAPAPLFTRSGNNLVITIGP